MYDSIDDLPFVCQLNLPEEALNVYRDAFNRAWRQADGSSNRHSMAQSHAWSAVRAAFERDQVTGRWVRKATTQGPRAAADAARAAAERRRNHS